MSLVWTRYQKTAQSPDLLQAAQENRGPQRPASATSPCQSRVPSTYTTVTRPRLPTMPFTSASSGIDRAFTLVGISARMV